MSYLRWIRQVGGVLIGTILILWTTNEMGTAFQNGGGLFQTLMVKNGEPAGPFEIGIPASLKASEICSASRSGSVSFLRISSIPNVGCGPINPLLVTVQLASRNVLAISSAYTAASGSFDACATTTGAGYDINNETMTSCCSALIRRPANFNLIRPCSARASSASFSKLAARSWALDASAWALAVSSLRVASFSSYSSSFALPSSLDEFLALYCIKYKQVREMRVKTTKKVTSLSQNVHHASNC